MANETAIADVDADVDADVGATHRQTGTWCDPGCGRGIVMLTAGGAAAPRTPPLALRPTECLKVREF